MTNAEHSFADDDLDENASNDKSRRIDLKDRPSRIRQSRQKRAGEHAIAQSEKLSKCSFLKNDTDDKRSFYREQIERACKANTLNGSEQESMQIQFSGQDTCTGSKMTLDAAGQNIGIDRDLQGKSRTSLDKHHAKPFWNRRKMLLEHKKAQRRRGASIGNWAFAHEELIQRVTSQEEGNKIVIRRGEKAQIFPANIRRKRPRLEHASSDRVSLSTTSIIGNDQNLKMRKGPKIGRGLLEILDDRPQNVNSA